MREKVSDVLSFLSNQNIIFFGDFYSKILSKNAENPLRISS